MSIAVLLKLQQTFNYKSSPLIRRHICSSQYLCGRRSRIPYDIRFPIFPDDVGPDKVGGKEFLPEYIARMDPNSPQEPGFYDRHHRFHFVKELVPEFIVPDLKDFKLQPYVSYRVPDVKQSEFTAKDLFDATYGQTVKSKHVDGKLDVQSIDVDSLVTNLSTVKKPT